MWTKISFLALWVVFFSLTYLLIQERNFSQSPRVEYVSNYDGDTIRVNIPGWPDIVGNKIAIRLAGVDTAEMRSRDRCQQKRAKQARAVVARILGNAQVIRLRNLRRGKYFRIVAEVEADGLNVGNELLARGLALPYSGGRKLKVDWCIPFEPSLR